MEKKTPIRQFELSKLINSSESSVLDKQLSEGFKNPVVKGVTEHINTKAIQPIAKTSDVFDKVAAFRAAKQAAKSGGAKMLGALPFVGAGIAALSGNPAMAAEEVVEDLAGPAGAIYGATKPAMTGPEMGSFDDRVSKGQLSEEDKLQLMQEQARIKALQGL